VFKSFNKRVIISSLIIRPVIAVQNSTMSSAKMGRENARLCAASLRVNHTVAMSGEQTVILERVAKVQPASIMLLGSVPLGAGRIASLAEPLPGPPLPEGFSGCVRDLQVYTGNFIGGAFHRLCFPYLRRQRGNSSRVELPRSKAFKGTRLVFWTKFVSRILPG